MNYLSICSGIEAASVAWRQFGWHPLAFSEIEPFPSAVLAHHWPDVPNLGDMTKHHDWPNTLRPDVVVGGTPCQAFSVAGLRKGLEDPRGNLTLVFLGILAQYRPRWVVWENVPGVLSDRTGAFGAFLGGLGELGYGFAYRVLDAQYHGVAQRRRRVFVVGYLGDWRRAAAVLFEPESLRGDPAPGRGEREVAPTIPARSLGGGGLGTDFDCDGGVIESFAIQAGALRENPESGPDGVGVQRDKAYTLEARAEVQAICMATGQGGAEIGIGIGTTLNCNSEAPVVATLDANYGKLQGCSGQDANHGHSHLLPVAFSGRARGDDGRGYDRAPQVFGSETVGTLDTVKPHCVAFEQRCGRNGRGMPSEVVPALKAEAGMTGKGDAAPCVATASVVRRLTTRECERLQGFPDDHTRIPWRGKPAEQCPDGPRYKAIGNSMAVPVMRWIGQNIQAIDQL